MSKQVGRLRIAVAIATTGRAPLLCKTLPLILDQSRRADRALVVAVTPADVEGVAESVPSVELMFSARGSCHQRNFALAKTKDDCDVIVFFDDDFIPARNFLATLEELFSTRDDVVAATGELVIDGVNFGGCELETARSMVSADQERSLKTSGVLDISHVYGCNMAARLPVAAEVGFDERMPLYAWQEDRDFSRRLKDHGRVVRAPALRGAHLGVTQGRSPGVRLGYSQVSNPLYLLSKGTMRPMETTILVGRSVAANFVKTFRPEPWVDRLGRLRGNLMALADVARGRVTPERILKL